MPGESQTPVDVLLVEDDPGDAAMVRESFAQSGSNARFHVVTGFRRALEFLRHAGQYEKAPKPALIILSFDLPDEHSLQFLSEVKGDRELKVIPVVVLSTSRDPDDAERTYGMYANAYVCKPGDFDGFADVAQKIDGLFMG